MHREREDEQNGAAVAWLILSVRQRMGLKQEQMAELLRVECVRYYQDLEYGHKQPSLQLFLRVLALSEAPISQEFHHRLRWPVPPRTLSLGCALISLAA
jgi:transcriptional regulator with XRE-family HTH domain